VGFAAGHPSPAQPASEPRTVSLYLTVEQGDKLIRGLGAQNFRVFERGEGRTFRLEEPEKPASIVLLVEYSRASWPYFNDILKGVEGFLSAAPEGHWYALVTFAHQATVQVDFTKTVGKLVAGLSGLQPPLWNEVDTYDALYETLEKLSRLSGRRVLVFVGSGLDTFSMHTQEDLQKLIEASNVVVFSAGAGSMLRGQYESYLDSTSRLNLLRAESLLKMLADKSGGQAWFPRFEQAFPDVMRGIVQTIESQYRLVYESRIPADGKFHKIKVEAFTLEGDQRTAYKVRVREGWRR
jgi:VWFA-related protein